MDTSLDDAEAACIKILKTLDKFPHNTNIEVIKEKITSIQKDITVSKKKIMMKSAEGAKLSQAVKHSALKLEKELTNLSKQTNPEVIDNLLNSLSIPLKELESNVFKTTMYWRSFEAVIT